MWAVLGLPCLLFVIGLLGGAMQWCSSCFSQWFSCCMGFWSCTMWWWVFLMMGIHFAFSIALGDMCEVYVTNAYVPEPSRVCQRAMTVLITVVVGRDGACV